jgi:hypothetical protein
MPSSLRVSRLRKSKVLFSPSRGKQMSQTNYNVMRNKALQQKLDATDRTHLTCELKKGNLVLTFSTAPLNNSELFSEIVPIIAHLVTLILKQQYVSLKINLPQLKKHNQLKEIVDNFIK